jgi:hypothetical protein
MTHRGTGEEAARKGGAQWLARGPNPWWARTGRCFVRWSLGPSGLVVFTRVTPVSVPGFSDWACLLIHGWPAC